jgi:hypothetical protein
MWFTETPWPPILICTVAIVCLVAMWQSNQRKGTLLAAGGLLIATVAIYFVERAIVTESEQLEAAVIELTDAFQRNDEQTTLSFFSKSAVEERLAVKAAMKLVDVGKDLRITDDHVRFMAGKTRAISHFRANATIKLAGRDFGKQPTRWELTWQREAEEWKIIRVQRLNPINGAPMGYMDRKTH